MRRESAAPYSIPAMVLAGMGLIGLPARAGSATTETMPPVPVVGGTEAPVCAWPTAAAFLQGSTVYCTGTLVHPQVVLTAAHCVDPQFSYAKPTAIAFGENGGQPQGTVGVVHCEKHPDWQYQPTFAKDLGYCLLAAPVTLPTVPVMMGCETEALAVGEEVTIVGFGATSSTLVATSTVELLGVGLKRSLTMTIDEITDNDEILISTRSGGGCNGDSGGPAMMQLSDGTWRVVGAASRRNVGSNWMPQVGDALCPEGLGLYYGLYHHEMQWFESKTGFDLTPCHDATGMWDPGPDCRRFPVDPDVGGGAWANACGPAQLGGDAGFCGDLPPDGGTGGSESGGEETSAGGTEGSTTTSSGDETGPDEMETDDGGSSSDESTGDPGVVDADPQTKGCSCRTDAGGRPETMWGLWMMVAVVAGRSARGQRHRR